LDEERPAGSPLELSRGLADMVYAFEPVLFQPRNPNISFSFIHYQQRNSLLNPDLFSLVETLKAKAKGDAC